MVTQTQIEKISSKYYFLGAIVVSVIALTSYFGTNQYFKGDVNSVPKETTGQPDLAIDKIYLDSSNRLSVVHSNQSTTEVTSDTKGHTYIYIYKNSDGSLYKKWTYSWSTLKDKNFLKANGSSIIQPQKLDSNDYTIQACIDPNNVVTNESNEAGKFDCATGSSANNFKKYNLKDQNKITVSVLPLSSSELIQGQNRDVFKFTVTASNVDIYLDRLTFQLAATPDVGATPDASAKIYLQDPQLYDASQTDSGSELNKTVIYDNAYQHLADDDDGSKDGIVDFRNIENIVFDFISPYKVPAGTTKTFIIKANVFDKNTVGTSYLSLTLLRDQTSISYDSVDDLDGGAGDSAYNFIWSDYKYPLVTEDKWLNGYTVKGGPSFTLVLSKTH